MSDGRPEGVHLVGSVPLASAEEVFRVACNILGARLRRLPDGETGPRSMWIGWQGRLVFRRHPQLVEVPPLPDEYPPVPHYRVRDDVDPGALAFENLGYADAALASWRDFQRLRSEGAIPDGVRFQVSLPTPLAPVENFVARDHQALVEPAYTARLMAEVDRIMAAVPHEHLAVQWDVCIEIWLWEGWLRSPFTDVRDGIIERLVRIGEAVPPDVELGYHLCYGDFQHKHFKEPVDTANLVAIANRLTNRLPRGVDWIHFPVPRERSDDAYFAPLKDLRLGSDTEVYVGLVHYTDGVEGTRKRIATARRYLPRFGVATECGLGRRPPETVPELLRIHAEVANPVGARQPT